MKIGRRGNQGDEPPRQSALGPITKENYVERAISFMRSSGRANGDHPVIRSAEGTHGATATGKQETGEQWRAWMAYFARINYPTVFAKKLGLMTVPTFWPWEFDRSAPEIVPAPEPPKAPHRHAAAVMDRAVHRFGHIPAQPRRPDYVPPEPPPIDHSTPVKLSASCRAVSGLAPLPIESAPQHEDYEDRA